VKVYLDDDDGRRLAGRGRAGGLRAGVRGADVWRASLIAERFAIGTVTPADGGGVPVVEPAVLRRRGSWWNCCRGGAARVLALQLRIP
jgi:hypothetical protein